MRSFEVDDMKMDRRNFLKCLAGGGALLAAGRIPAIAAGETDGENLFAKRGEWERLSLGYITLKIGATRPFSVLHVSDTHLADAHPDENERKVRLAGMRRKQFGGRQLDALADSLAWAKTHDDFVVHTGDLIDFQSRANYGHVARLFGGNLVGTVGNHEYSPEMWLSEVPETRDEAQRACSREELKKVLPFELSFSSHIVNGVNFVMMDDAFGTVTEDQLDAFMDETRKGLPIVLGLHVPIFTDSVVRAWRHYWRKGGGRLATAALPEPTDEWLAQKKDAATVRFLQEVGTQPLLKAVLAGHLHFDIQDRLSPTAVQYVVGGNYLFKGQEVFFV